MENNSPQNLNPEQSSIIPISPTPTKKLSNKIIAVVLLAVVAGVVSWVALSRQPKTDLNPIVVNHQIKSQEDLIAEVKSQLASSVPAVWGQIQKVDVFQSGDYPEANTFSATFSNQI